MQFSIILGALLAVTTVFAQQFPNCAADCITHADTGGCGTDNKCLCESSAFVKSTGDCFIAKCQGQDLQTAFKQSQALCLAAGVTSTSDFGSATVQHTNTNTNTNTAANSQSTNPSQQSKNGASLNRVDVLSGLVISAGLIALAM
ncbi:hypothetical protein E1B28_006724 [Marasmius oreades]|uniref:CFEM domain-containing protein n=1 Tax=Marasmius oreades TaxID=181124 RepID=A0A9P8AAZ4_9AGAR|nr:uncharacterized protein E1B28_006724 [Marasmius oreades]KAG7096043.1 hypothetical protein E1B28_006724 [Marasmius oreades]